jgi:hypothetical protein
MSRVRLKLRVINQLDKGAYYKSGVYRLITPTKK